MKQFKSIKKHFGRKISWKIFFPIIIIFSILTILILNNSFSVNASPYQKKSIKTVNNYLGQTIVTSPTKQVSSPSASVSTVTKPVISGNQIKIPILYYHYVGNNPNPADLQRNALSISPDKFEEEMKYLKDNGYVTVTFDTLYAALKKQTKLPDKAIILTFDDGYIDFYYNAYNILRKYGFSAVLFIPTGLVGKPAYLTWDMIREMHASGLIYFGAHSVHHYQLTSLSSEQAFYEIEESKKVLQDNLGVPINFMAYPYGSTNDNVINLVKKAGYVGAIGTWRSEIESEGTIFNMPRLRVNGMAGLSTFVSLFQ